MKNKQTIKTAIRKRRAVRTRSNINGTAESPRLSVRRSLRYLAAQAIDDSRGITLVGLHENKLKLKGDKTTRAKEFGKVFAEKLKEKKITTIIFDKGEFKYHGRVKQFADSLREQGIKF
ncbi:MAG: 50S ribosomal protein L18 [Parcubacteria group bacterium CG1_02_37_51]|uniref:Large ribosomal subunit protein uL18 n=2 Tax=Candidatus Komeiliibacteriota TaxID=1817908 RepID=A0A2M8DRI5_9BACT|nr:MAG: 50S ribosomal protein L18 [Parcubacteria group bacterium CG1_02_37_51]PIY94815.1 MAG: 50S ribosomal protein L18 [Candidatus Komeilibacteria bacterium CG_4_10_14_0_8_um_filter_37_78]PJC01993.1 MAG: 50S ribosomal protein L18 [Candidatus Komeilibacteria bacterium CG_4_9_14_0_8_um_filter_36_9]